LAKPGARRLEAAQRRERIVAISKTSAGAGTARAPTDDRLPAEPSREELRAAYLQLLKLSLIDMLGPQPLKAVEAPGDEVRIVPLADEDRAQRLEGRDLPVNGVSMMGLERLGNLQRCVEDVIRRDVPGDLIEAGVWRGGGTILMRSILRLYGVLDRSVWAADSFEGLPPPRPEEYPVDTGSRLHHQSYLRVSVEEVKRNFERYGVLDEQVRFLEGWFSDTLPTVRDRTWSLIRLDGDMYESTIVALENLYPQLSPGGFLIVDDYGAFRKCKQAVHDFRAQHDIREPIEQVDWTGAFWKKQE
jgi:O-methyltransferase